MRNKPKFGVPCEIRNITKNQIIKKHHDESGLWDADFMESLNGINFCVTH